MSGKEGSLLATNLRLKNDVWLNALVIHEVNVCMCTNSHTLVRMHVTEYQKSAGITPASLATHHCGPATCKFQPSISVEALSCRLSSVAVLCRVSFTNPWHGPGVDTLSKVNNTTTNGYNYHIAAAVARTILGRWNKDRTQDWINTCKGILWNFGTMHVLCILYLILPFSALRWQQSQL